MLSAALGFHLVRQMTAEMVSGAAVLEMVSKRSGNVISEISVDEAGRWRKTTQPVIDAWIASAKDRNLDGAKLVEAVRTLVQKYKVS